MSYSMVHLEVAYRLLDRFDWVERRGDFLLGAIAPDAVHFREDYEVRLKEQSHLWDCGPKWGITTDSDRWRDNVLAFWSENRTAPNRDFLAGYCVHILTDWLNNLRIWAPFREENARGDEVAEIYQIYGREALGSDRWLYRNSENSEEIFRLLAEGRAYPISGCIEQEEVERQKESLLLWELESGERCDISGYRYCTEGVILAFIDECVETFSGML